MPFKKGMKKTGGRQKGSKNISTLTKKSFLDYVANEGSDRFMDELKKLEGESYVKYFVHLLEFNYPKLSRAEVTGKDGEALWDVNKAIEVLKQYERRGQGDSDHSKE